MQKTLLDQMICILHSTYITIKSVYNAHKVKKSNLNNRLKYIMSTLYLQGHNIMSMHHCMWLGLNYMPLLQLCH